MRTTFRFIVVNSHYRHLRNGCSAEARAPMLPHEANWPLCPECVENVRRDLAADLGLSASEPVRCDACGGWRRAGSSCPNHGSQVRL